VRADASSSDPDSVSFLLPDYFALRSVLVEMFL
jgi:hypothetical protein